VVVFHLPGALAPFAGGRSRVVVEGPGQDVGSALRALAMLHPGLCDRVLDERGAVRLHVNVFVGPDNVRDTGGLATPLPPGAEVFILPSVSGG
jgi:sulfur-carrier protein